MTFYKDNRITRLLNRRVSGSDAGTTRDPSEHRSKLVEAHTVGHTVRTARSPRKSLPSHWIPKSSGPKLATAQRAKERSHKKDPQSGSPVETKTIRGARSIIELRKAQSVESPSYLTKEALAAADNDIASLTSTRSPIRLHRSPSKPCWRSPTTSPSQNRPGQPVTITTKISPTRAALLSAGTASSGHSRAPSSTAASCGTFHTANEPPVRSPSGSVNSFRSASEYPQDMEILALTYDTNVVILQTARNTESAGPVRSKAATVGKKSVPRPRLVLKIPAPGSITDSNSPNTCASATDGSLTSSSSFSPESPRLTCRIPRLAATVKSGSAYSATRSSTLKRAQSVKTQGPKLNIQQDHTLEARQIILPETPAAASLRHVRTVNSFGVTPILSDNSTRDVPRSSGDSELQDPGFALGISVPDPISHKVPGCMSVTGLKPPDLIKSEGIDIDLRASSIATVKASPSLRDPVPMDSAIIYSRKKVDDRSTIRGMTFRVPIIESLIIKIVMAYDTDLTSSIGNIQVCKIIEDSGPALHSVASPTAAAARGRSDQYDSDTRQHTERQHSHQHTLGTELRATAPDFVPQSTPISFPEITPIDTFTPPQSDQAPWFPLDMSGLDKHGIPWFYYMYPVQFAYDQGIRNGRAKSPRKMRNRKHWQSLHPPIDVQQCARIQDSPTSKTNPAVSAPAIVTPRQTSSELMPPPTRPAHRREQIVNKNSMRGGGITPAGGSEGSSGTLDTSRPFSSQLEFIYNNTNKARHHRNYDVDLTNVRNVVPLPGHHGESYTNYHTVSSRYGRYHHSYAGNGLYNGRGSAGVPMSATTPFPDPSPPQGRPPLGAGGRPATIGTEACGMVDVVFAAELGGGVPCNTCAPDH